MGTGVVIRDHEGGLRAAKCSFISGKFDPTCSSGSNGSSSCDLFLQKIGD